MRYYSTNNKTLTVTLEQAVIQGLAPDGGLLLPEHIPALPDAFVRNMGSMSLHEISYAVANYALQGDIDAAVLKSAVADTLSFDLPLVHLGGNQYVLELFHGPTMSFKDIGTRFLARLLAHYNGRHRRNISVIVATSGNSGGAIAHSFSDIPEVQVYILYPRGELDEVQRAQFAAMQAPNISAIEVNGSLDDCRKLADQAFRDPDIGSRMIVNSARTVNVARLLPQMFHYFWAAAQLMQREQDPSQMVVAMPCGNLGNLTAGIMAKRMGLPVKRFVAVNNANDAFVRYLLTGDYVPHPLRRTATPAIDIAEPSNFTRIKALYGGSHFELCRDVEPYRCTDADVSDAMRRLWTAHSYVADPHTAAACMAVNACLRPGEVGVALATAHPAKFRAQVEAATGHSIELPQRLAADLGAPQHVSVINSGYTSLKKFLLQQTD